MTTKTYLVNMSHLAQFTYTVDAEDEDQAMLAAQALYDAEVALDSNPWSDGTCDIDETTEISDSQAEGRILDASHVLALSAKEDQGKDGDDVRFEIDAYRKHGGRSFE